MNSALHLLPSRRFAYTSLLFLFVLLQGIAFRWAPVDDAYISMRYARNWAAGHGLVFNPAERVEGFTNFAWTAILAAAAALRVDLPAFSVIASCLFCLVTLFLTLRLAERAYLEFDLPTGRAWIPPLILALYPGWAYWAFSGMEGMLAASLYLGVLLAACRPLTHRSDPLLVGTLLALAAMTRWEAVLLLPVVVVAIVVYGRDRSRRQRFTHAIVTGATFLLLFGVYFAARYAYYGELLPNTYFAKTGGPSTARLPNGLIYTGELGVTFLLPVTGLVLLRWIRLPIAKVFLMLFVCQGIFAIWAGGDFFPWLRFYVPILPVCAILMGICIELSLAHRARTKRSSRAVLAMFMIPAVVLSGFVIDLGSALAHAGLVRQWKDVGRWTSATFPEDYQVALAPIGAVGFFSDRKIIDILGLTDYDTAHFGQWDVSEPPGHQMSDLDAMLGRRPELVLGNAPTFDHEPTVEEVHRASFRRTLKRLFARPDFQAAYVFRTASFEGRIIPYWIRRDLAAEKGTLPAPVR
ncbi:MAG: hypothetical protein J5J06_10195 [Phycisphaerae bacterium]|nr:hypothetical protein [Phycisphaerae bacterium]